ncbi:MAG: alpha/beta fold hydrolase [Rhodospirillales bacterium]|nr:alpha/beta fold hydrolase [Rhodospirillales bacterium]
MDVAVDGNRVFAATGGRPFDPAQPTVLFIHGAGMDHTVWALQTRYLAHHGRSVLAVDLPGHGRSGGALLRSIAEMASWIVRLLDAAGVQSAALVGHSMGALIALEVAAAAPARVRSLGLLGVAERMPVHPDLQAAADGNRRLAPELVSSWGHGRSGHLGGNPAPGLWMMGGSLQLLERAPPGALAADLAACNAYDGALAAAARVTCPTLLLLGALDRMTPPAKAKPLADAIKRARTVVLPAAGHMLMSERPDAVIDALREAI